MTMNSRWRSLFFSFTNAPVTGFPEASCTTPSTVEVFSAALASSPDRSSRALAKMSVNFDHIPFDFILDLLVRSLIVSWQRFLHHSLTCLDVRKETFKISFCPSDLRHYTPNRCRHNQTL